LGFTLIEVLLFLAVSTLIIVALMTGIGTTVARQRYNDSVQDLVQYLRKQYADVITTANSRGMSDATCTSYQDVRSRLISAADTIFTGADVLPANMKTALNGLKSIDVDGDGRGRSDCVIYGKLVILGQGEYSTPSIPGSGNEVITYDVIGTDMTADLRKLDNLTNRNSLIVTVPALLDGTCNMGDASLVDRYRLGWQAQVSTTDAIPTALQAAILIIRSPITGTVHTLIAEDSDHEFVNRVGNNMYFDGTTCSYSTGENSLWELIGRANNPLSLDTSIDMCISSEDTYAVEGRRRMITIKADGRNGTAVELLPADDEGANLCL
jgi:type II secretory pathway pseudopilin PulG